MSKKRIFISTAADHALSISVSLILAIGLGVIAARNIPPRVVSVDLQALVDEEQSRTMTRLGIPSGQALTSEQRDIRERLGVEFAQKLSAAVDLVASECNCILVNKAALLGGRYGDVTAEIRDLVAGR